MTKTIWMVVVLGALAAGGCSSVLGFKDPQLESDDAPQDAKIGGPGIDAKRLDAGPIDAPTDAAIDAPPAGCQPSACAFGCDPNTKMCRTDGTLYVYATGGQFAANDFGGKDNPPTVRASSDARCFDDAKRQFSALNCDLTRTHAVLYVSGADSLALMASKYSIPTTAPVHRADDNVLVFNNWNDLVDSTKTPRIVVTTTPVDVWSGANETATCKNWTSLANGDTTINGIIGRTSVVSTNWLNRVGVSCDLLEHLLCICWSGGN